MHRVKDYIHNLGEAIAEVMDDHSHCVDLSCQQDAWYRKKIYEAQAQYNEACTFCRNFCDHKDESLYHMEECPSVGLGSRKL